MLSTVTVECEASAWPGRRQKQIAMAVSGKQHWGRDDDSQRTACSQTSPWPRIGTRYYWVLWRWACRRCGDDPSGLVIPLRHDAFGMQAQLLTCEGVRMWSRHSISDQRNAPGLVVGLEALIQANVKLIAALATQNRLQTIFAREFVEAGGLIAYAVSYPKFVRRAAYFVNKMLKARQARRPTRQAAHQV
jgi:hypothetical protein